MKISIVTAYYNRKKLFHNTLLQLKYSSVTDFEFIVVDDGSNDENRLEDFLAEFDFLKIIRIEPSEKWYVNPCIPFNKGIRAAKGEIILLQNPECMHYGDVLAYVAHRIKPNEYISFASYSLDKETTNHLDTGCITGTEYPGLHFLQKKIEYDGEAGWYNHSIYKPRGFHWCAAIHRVDLLDLGGFDEQFAMGVGFDDEELLTRIKDKGMDIRIIDKPFVLHQNHFIKNADSRAHVNPFYSRKNAAFLWEKNEYLVRNHTPKNRNGKFPAKSAAQIRFNDFILTTKLKWRANYSSFTRRLKNKISRTFR